MTKVNKKIQKKMGRPSLWSEASLQAQALKYTSRSEWERGDEKSYAAARRRGLLDKLCSHMRTAKRSSWHAWTVKELRAIALTFTTKKDWERDDEKSYAAARRRGLLDKLCRHMESGRSNPRPRKWVWSREEKRWAELSAHFSFGRQKTQNLSFLFFFRGLAFCIFFGPGKRIDIFIIGFRYLWSEKDGGRDARPRGVKNIISAGLFFLPRSRSRYHR